MDMNTESYGQKPALSSDVPATGQAPRNRAEVENLQFSLPQRGLGMELVYTAGFENHKWAVQASEHNTRGGLEHLLNEEYDPQAQREKWAPALYDESDVEAL